MCNSKISVKYKLACVEGICDPASSQSVGIDACEQLIVKVTVTSSHRIVQNILNYRLYIGLFPWFIAVNCEIN